MPQPATLRLPEHQSGLRVAVQVPTLRGNNLDLADELGVELWTAVKAAFQEAGFVTASSGVADAVADLTLTVRYVYADYLEVAPELVVRSPGGLIQTSLPMAKWATSGYSAAAAKALVNQVVSQLPGSVSATSYVPTKPDPVQPPRPFVIVAIFDVQDLTDTFGPTFCDQLTEYLVATGARLMRWRAVPRAEITSQLQDAKSGSYRACVDESCQIELGKAVAAEQALATKVLRFGTTCALTASLFDLRTEATERTGSVQTKCDPDSLVAAADVLVQQLAAEAPQRR
ncbi:MAG: hypothetical protein HY791_28895 [Deltaproteobacteria bacterium]|nr:hypothetical protein [Deltaproteobacteria bacterium]